ncbi:asparagine synthase (glutamine-hydrolyzing) [Fibrobacterota bacterium]
MCGLAGIYNTKSEITESDVDLVLRMRDRQAHRGPDDEGLFHDKRCALGHNRLAIIDLSRDGRQPFYSDDRRHVMVFNGEIYNYLELREELRSAGWRFHTKTDTEVLLKAYLAWGKECLEKLNGMFAFVVYDSLNGGLFMARDRVGIKPLYYGFQGNTLYFASELKALLLVNDMDRSINYQSVFDYLVFNRTDVYDETFFCGIKRLPNGHFAVLDAQGFIRSKWWDPEHYVSANSTEDPGTVFENIKNILLSSIQLRMRSDVTVGSCLSGGLDSSIILGMLFKHHSLQDDFLTFTASFPGHAIDETAYISHLNNTYGFINHKTFPTSGQAHADLDDFVYCNDEPTTNSSFYAQYEVMRLAKARGVKVLLDGQGGDETFAGYQYFHGYFMNSLLQKKGYLKFMKELISAIVRRQDFSAYQTLAFLRCGNKLKKRLLLATVPFLSRDFFNTYIESSIIFSDFFQAETLNTSIAKHFKYKLEHLLRMEDRNSMAFSLEARVPYLDHRLIEYVLGLPEELKISGGHTKYLQKQAIGQYTVPRILERKDKVGFDTPLDDWMSTALWKRFTAENLDYLSRECNGIIKNHKPSPEKGSDKWKLNQLAVWHKQVSR